MRLRRNTLLLVLASALVIVLVLLLSPKETSAPTPATPVVDAESGPLLPDLTAADLAGVALRDNENGRFIQFTREDEGWTLGGPAEAAERSVDQTAAQAAIDDILALAVNSRFEIEDAAAFGLAAPAFTLELDRGEGPLEVVFVGAENPQGTRYYVMTRQLDVAAGADLAAPDLAQGALVQLVNSSALERVTRLLDAPPWLPLPTATPTATATLNPLSEVEMATATAAAESSAVMATLTAEAGVNATPTPSTAG